jgi:hypothetical protein
MSGRFLVLLLLLAALVTAATYAYTAEKHEILSDQGLADLERIITVHGWPWGYHGEVLELVRYTESQVAIMEYKEWYFEQFGQTYLVWFVALLILVATILILIAPPQKRA